MEDNEGYHEGKLMIEKQIEWGVMGESHWGNETVLTIFKRGK